MVIESSKNLSSIFMRILVFGACVPVIVALIFLYFLIQTNEKNVSSYYREQKQEVKHSIEGIFGRIYDSLDKIQQSKEILVYLNSQADTREIEADKLESYFVNEKTRMNNIDYSYCIYRANKNLLLGKKNCFVFDLKGDNGILYYEEHAIFFIYKKFYFKSDFGEYPLFISASVPFNEIQNHFSQVKALNLKSNNIEKVDFDVEMQFDVFNLTSIRKIYFVIFGSMLFFLFSILYGTKFSYFLKKKTENSLRLATIGKIAHYLAHDIQKPFQNISIFQKSLKSCSTQKEADLLISETQKSLKASEILIQNTLKELMYTNSQKLKIQFHLNLKKMIEDCLLSVSNNHSNLKIIFDISHSLHLNADAAQLSRVFMNLISNAIDATQHTDQAVLKISSYNYKNNIRLVFYNSHSFISKNVQQRIFEPFFTTKGELGTGLGLATSKKIIENHGGKISCHSKKGYGVEFIINLPARTGNTVVVIDDCPLTLRSWTRHFQNNSPMCKVKAFLSFKDFFDWQEKYNPNEHQISDIICDYNVNDNRYSAKQAIKKIEHLFKNIIYISTHHEHTQVFNELKMKNLMFISK